MAVSSDFTQFVLDQLSGWGNVYINKMFGCVALYQDDLAFGMIANDVVYLKVDDSNRAKFIESGSVPLKPFKSNATVLSFYNISADILEDSDAFIRWAKESLEIQTKQIKSTNMEKLNILWTSKDKDTFMYMVALYANN